MRTFAGTAASALPSIVVCVSAAARPCPQVLDRRVRIDDLRQLLTSVTRQKAVAAAARILLFEICIRETRRRERGVSRQGEALVEGALPGTGNVRPDGIEYTAVTFVRVEAVVEELSKKPSALRDAEDVRGSTAHRKIGAVLERRRGVANRREPDARHASPGSRIIHLVHTPWLEAAVEDEPGTPVRPCRRKSPHGPRNRCRTFPEEIADGQRGGWIVRIDRRIRREVTQRRILA